MEIATGGRARVTTLAIAPVPKNYRYGICLTSYRKKNIVTPRAKAPEPKKVALKFLP
jgi:hypothetical protein